MLALKLTCLIGLIAAGYFHFHISLPEKMPTEEKWLMRKLSTLHKIGKLLTRIAVAVGFGAPHTITRRAKDFVAPWMRTDNLEVQSRDLVFDGVPVTVHVKGGRRTREDDGLRPGIFFIHGGGWIFEFKELFAVMERHLADQLDIVLVSVHYRLAPEHPYPEPLNDCLAALRYFHLHCNEFGVDPDKITIAGDSAGGNMAAAATLKLRDAGENFLHRQILISPVTQFSTFLTSSYVDNAKYSLITEPTFLLYMNESIYFLEDLGKNRHISDRILQHRSWPYVSKTHKEEHIHEPRDENVSRLFADKTADPYLCPMMADSLSGLPPALILASEFDMFRDDAVMYADRLAAEGTETELVMNDGFHGVYCFFDQSPMGSGMLDSIVKYLKNVYKEI